MKQLIPLVLIVFAGVAHADGEAQYKYRDAVMESVGGHMSSMATILRGRVYPDDLAFHANAMKNLATIVPHVFPEGSGVSDSEALPEIWEEPEDFKAAMDEFVNAANGMAEAANSGDMGQVGPAIKALGQACKGCHDSFRAE